MQKNRLKSQRQGLLENNFVSKQNKHWLYNIVKRQRAFIHVILLFLVTNATHAQLDPSLDKYDSIYTKLLSSEQYKKSLSFESPYQFNFSTILYTPKSLIYNADIATIDGASNENISFELVLIDRNKWEDFIRQKNPNWAAIEASIIASIAKLCKDSTLMINIPVKYVKSNAVLVARLKKDAKYMVLDAQKIKPFKQDFVKINNNDFLVSMDKDYMIERMNIYDKLIAKNLHISSPLESILFAQNISNDFHFTNNVNPDFYNTNNINLPENILNQLSSEVINQVQANTSLYSKRITEINNNTIGKDLDNIFHERAMIQILCKDKQLLAQLVKKYLDYLKLKQDEYIVHKRRQADILRNGGNIIVPRGGDTACDCIKMVNVGNNTVQTPTFWGMWKTDWLPDFGHIKPNWRQFDPILTTYPESSYHTDRYAIIAGPGKVFEVAQHGHCGDQHPEVNTCGFDSTNSQSGSSASVSFWLRQFCMDNATMPDTCACEFDVDVKYRYSTHLIADASRPYSCTWSAVAQAHAEDWVLCTYAYSKDNQVIAFAGGRDKVTSHIAVTPNADFWNSIGTFGSNVLNNISSKNWSALITQGIGNLYSIFTTPVTNVSQSPREEKNSTLVNGVKTFTVKQDQLLIVSMNNSFQTFNTGEDGFCSLAHIGSNFELGFVVGSFNQPHEYCCRPEYGAWYGYGDGDWGAYNANAMNDFFWVRTSDYPNHYIYDGYEQGHYEGPNICDYQGVADVRFTKSAKAELKKSLDFIQRNNTLLWQCENDNEYQVKVIDLSGKVVLTTKGTPKMNSEILNFSNLVNGVYLVQISNQYESQSNKIFKFD